MVNSARVPDPETPPAPDDLPILPDPEAQAAWESMPGELRAAPEHYLAEYARRFGNVLNADDAATLFDLYNQDRARFQVAVHPAATWIRDELFRRVLAVPATDAKRSVVFTAGSNAAGKSTAIAFASVEREALAIFDSTFSNAAHARALVAQALVAGRPVTILHVDRVVGRRAARYAEVTADLSEAEGCDAAAPQILIASPRTAEASGRRFAITLTRRYFHSGRLSRRMGFYPFPATPSHFRSACPAPLRLHISGCDGTGSLGSESTSAARWRLHLSRGAVPSINTSVVVSVQRSPASLPLSRQIFADTIPAGRGNSRAFR